MTNTNNILYDQYKQYTLWPVQTIYSMTSANNILYDQYPDVISDFHSDAHEIFALLGCYTVEIGSYLPTVWDNLLVPSSRVKESKKSKDSSTQT